MPKITSRTDAFAQPLSEDWQPKAGERVFLSERYKRKTAVLKFLDGEWGRVIFRRKGFREYAVKREELRPMGEHQKKIWGSHGRE